MGDLVSPERAAELNAEVSEQQAYRQRAREANWRTAARIPSKWGELRWEELDTKETPSRAHAVEAARRWAGDELLGLLLIGPVGIGKTRIAATAALGRLRHGPVRWLSVADLLMALRMPFDSPEYVAAMRSLDPGSGTALVLDDLDKTKPTEHAVQPLYAAVNRWIEAEQPLAVTMNHSLDELSVDFGERFGTAIASRLAEHCSVFELSGRDRRIEP